jgi:hypothetical protein
MRQTTFLLQFFGIKRSNDQIEHIINLRYLKYQLGFDLLIIQNNTILVLINRAPSNQVT